MMLFVLLACFVAVHSSGIAHVVHQPQPYSFGYTIKDKEGVQHREEAANGVGVVKGNYGFIDNKGLQRQVDYVADHAGFRAAIKTNEPGTAGQSPAAVSMMSNDPYAHVAAVPYVSRVNDPVVPALYESNGVYRFPTIYGHRAYGHEAHDQAHYAPVHGHGVYGPAQYAPVQGHGLVAPVQHHGQVAPVYGYNGGLVNGYGYNNGLGYGGGYGPVYGQGYFGGLSHSNLLGAGYRGLGGVVNYGANLIGGQIRGFDTRFTNL